MTPEEVRVGADIAERALQFVVFAERCDPWKVGEARRLITELFGPEVDAELMRRFSTPNASYTAPGQGACQP